MKSKLQRLERPDILSFFVFLIIATITILLLYEMAYKPDVITFWGPWPAWYVVCCWGFFAVSLAAGTIIAFFCYDDSDFTVKESEILTPEQIEEVLKS